MVGKRVAWIAVGSLVGAACGDSRSPPSQLAATSAEQVSGAQASASASSAKGASVVAEEAPPAVLFVPAAELPRGLTMLRRENVSGLDRVGKYTRGASLAYYMCGSPPLTRMATVPQTQAGALVMLRALQEPADIASFVRCGAQLDAAARRRMHTLSFETSSGLAPREVRVFPTNEAIAPEHFVKQADESGLSSVRCLAGSSKGCDANSFAMARIERFGRTAAGALADLRVVATGPRLAPAQAARFERFAHLDSFRGDVWIGSDEGALVGMFDLGGMPESATKRASTVEELRKAGVFGGTALGDDLLGPAQVEWLPDSPDSLPRLATLMREISQDHHERPRPPKDAFEARYMHDAAQAVRAGVRQAQPSAIGDRVRMEFDVSVARADLDSYFAARSERFAVLERILGAADAGQTASSEDLLALLGPRYEPAKQLLGSWRGGGPITRVQVLDGLDVPKGEVSIDAAGTRVAYSSEASGKRFLEMDELLRSAGYRLHVRYLNQVYVGARATRGSESIEITWLELTGTTEVTFRRGEPKSP